MDTSNKPDQILQLRNYIQQQLHLGLSPDEIMASLKKSGWDEGSITQAFQAAQSQIMPPGVQSAMPNNVSEQPLPQSTGTEPVFTGKKRGRMRSGWILLRESLKVLKSDKMLTRYVIMATIFSAGLTIIYIIVLILGRGAFLTSSVVNGKTQYNLTLIGYIPTFFYYVVAFFIVNLYMAGLAANVLDLFHGTKGPYKSYMKKAMSKAGQLFVFSLLEATVGLILRAIAERSKLLGRIVVSIIGAAWSIARLFVVPIIVSSDEKAIPAIKDSTKLIITTWGENIVGRVSLGGIIFLVYLFIVLPLSILMFILLGALLQGVGIIIAFVLLLMLLIGFCIVVSTASNILNVALFYYAKNKQVPAVFNAELLHSAFIQKKPRKGLLKKLA